MFFGWSLAGVIAGNYTVAAYNNLTLVLNIIT